jgi:hypothetical protein
MGSQNKLSFDISTPHLIESLGYLQGRADSLKLNIMKIDDLPVLRLKALSAGAVNDIGIEFRMENDANDYTIPPCSQESVSLSMGFR